MSVIPLESNPEVFTQYATKLGLGPLVSFGDIYSLRDADLISFMPRPVHAIVLLFPISEGYQKLKSAEESQRKAETLDLSSVSIDSPEDSESSIVDSQQYIIDNNIFWFKQVIKNACGLYALLHALLNVPEGLLIKDGLLSQLKQKLIASRDLPDSSVNVIEYVTQIGDSMHEEFAEQGQTEAPAAEEDVDLHFITFVKTPAGMVELDGGRNGPVLLSRASEDLGDVISSEAVISRIEKYMSLAEGDQALKFAMMGLGPSQD